MANRYHCIIMVHYEWLDSLSMLIIMCRSMFGAAFNEQYLTASLAADCWLIVPHLIESNTTLCLSDRHNEAQQF
jgi:hypothetical protein